MDKKINRFTKKKLIEGAKLCYKYGYWSSEVREFLDKFDTKPREKMCVALHNIYSSNKVNTESSQYYDFLNTLGLVQGAKDSSIVSSKVQQEKDRQWIMRESEKVNSLLAKCTKETIINRMVSGY